MNALGTTGVRGFVALGSDAPDGVEIDVLAPSALKPESVAADDPRVWWLWVVGGLVAWVLLAFAAALTIGGTIRLADRKAAPSDPVGVGALDERAGSRHARWPATSGNSPRRRRRAVPLPPVGVALAALAVACPASGYVLRLTQGAGSTTNVLSLDGPHPVSHLYAGLLFAVAAVSAVIGAARAHGRRPWWFAVGLVGGVLAVGTAGEVDPPGGSAVLLWGLAAGVVLVGLWLLNPGERRDRRRIVGALAGYAAAFVGLAVTAAAVRNGYGVTSTAAVTVTFLQHAAATLSGVAFLVAVLVGVAPGLVLPKAWALRRAEDASAVDVPTGAPVRHVFRSGAPT